MSTRVVCVTKTIFAALCLTLLSRSAALSQAVQANPDVFQASKHALSPPLRDIRPALPVPGPPRVIQHGGHPAKITPAQPDPVLQTIPGQPFVAVGSSFDGVYDTSQADVSGVLYAPPDTNGAVGATQYVQWVNYAFAVFDKTGAKLAGPIKGSDLWAKLGGQCASNNSGDPIAQYDKAADRWVMMQPVFTKPFVICIAVSTTSLAQEPWNLYEFPMPGFPDYPKLGIWPDGYYVSIDLYNNGLGFGGKFLGPYLCAFDRSAMLAGFPPMPQMKCFQLSANYQSLLPSDLDGLLQHAPAGAPPWPPSGSPNYFLNLGSDSKSLNLWKFHVDFGNLDNSTLTGPINIPVANFTEACGGGICIPQAGTKGLLDSLGDRLMYRLAYRNLGDHEALVVNHSVATGTTWSNVGVRWYEVRNPNGATLANATDVTPPVVFQQGSFAPDAKFRWMGSVAMDKFGDMAVGYSVSSSSIHPSIGVTGRVPKDTPGTLKDPLGTLEAEILLSLPLPGGSQLKVSNWGDYSSMSVDPVDDCTFWFTTEYLQTDGNFNWRTRIVPFKFPSCL